MFSGLCAEDEWAIVEDNINEGKMRLQETIFTLGNGYLGSRGILEEGYTEGYPGTYIAGIFDQSEGQSYEIVNAPNAVNIEVLINGKKLSKDTMKIIEHRRMLDMQRSVLRRRTVFADAGGRYEYESARFFSLRDVHVGVMTFSLRLLDLDASVTVRHTVDGSTRNEIQAVGNAIKHYSVSEASVLTNGVLYLEAKTNDLGILIGIAAACEMVAVTPPHGEMAAESYTDNESVRRQFSFNAKKGKRYRFNIYISTNTSRELKQSPKVDCLDGVRRATQRGVLRLLEDHTKAWGRRWEDSDIKIDGDASIQKALRFDMYHLLIAASPEDMDVSIAAKTLSGEWYKGHVFWDTEIYVLPFFTYTQPQLARNILLYRYRRLKQARDGAQIQGYKGALWPWESAASGKDETPRCWVNFDGTEIPVYNSIREHHIAGDVIYGVLSYYAATGDEDFMLNYGAEMIFETARFWASRVTYDRRRRHYGIKKVIGPNEFHESVDNNSYTNYLAKWVLRSGSELHDYLSRRHPRRLITIAKRLALKEHEINMWKRLSSRIVFLTEASGLIEEFEGYSGKKDVIISQWDKNSMPVWPSTVKLAEAKLTQLVKQADVILLLHLFSNDFSPATKRTNLEYYDKRTVHKSSLSIPSYAVIALELGEVEKAYKYLTLAANGDLGDVYRNTEYGAHAAALGGAWQIVIHGFAGVRLRDGVLSANPILPSHWQKMRFRVWFRGSLVEFAVSTSEAQAVVLRGRKTVDVELYGQRYSLHKGRKTHAKKN